MGWRQQQTAGPPCPWHVGQPDLSPEVAPAVDPQRLCSAPGSATAAEICSFALPQLWVAAPHTTFFIVFVLSDRCLDWKTLLGQAGLWRGGRCGKVRSDSCGREEKVQWGM